MHLPLYVFWDFFSFPHELLFWEIYLDYFIGKMFYTNVKTRNIIRHSCEHLILCSQRMQC